MTTLERSSGPLFRSGAEAAALAEYFCLRAFAAGSLFCAAASVSAIAMLPLRDSATPVAWTTPTVILTGFVALVSLVIAWHPAAVYRALVLRPALEGVPVLLAAAMLAYPLRSELWWPSCAIVMLVAQVAPLGRTWAYCASVLVINLLAHAVAGDLSETPAVSIVGLWIGFGFWATLAGLLVERIARHLIRLDIGRSYAAAAHRMPPRAPAAAPTEPADPVGTDQTENLVPEPSPELPPPRADDRTQGLTKRQLQVVALLADGLRHDEVAACLSISRTQVGRHVAAAVRRMGAANANELVALAVASGLVPPVD